MASLAEVMRSGTFTVFLVANLLCTVRLLAKSLHM